MLRTFSAAALLSIAGAAFAQSTQPGSATPSVTQSDTPSVTQSDTPSVTPSQTPAVSPSQTPVSPPSTPAMTPHSNPAAVGGLSKCENLLGTDKDRCQQQERAAAGGAIGSTAPRQ